MRIATSQRDSQTSDSPAAAGVMQRKCACAGSLGSECEECKKDMDESMQRSSAAPRRFAGLPAPVRDTLAAPGQPLDAASRRFFEPRFGHDFSQVRVHSDSRAAASARDVDARAYTVGHHVVFGDGQYSPESRAGRKLLAHELTHVVQQRTLPQLKSADPYTIDAPDNPLEREARSAESAILSARPAPVALSTATRPLLSRADPVAVSRTQTLGGVVGSGIQFLPPNLTDTVVGPVSVRSGLLGDRASRLNIIVGENLTLRDLATRILPLWNTATPFTPPGAAAPNPLTLITADELAQGLLVYNRYYIGIPSMTKWSAGLRFPLPVQIDETSGVATLHPLQIQALATGFDPAWAPLLDVGAPATTAPPQATLQADVTAFLADPDRSSALSRGIHLGARAITNAVSTLPFLREVFRQLGAGAFDVALNFMDFLVNRQISILAAQRDGAAILAEISSIISAPPATLTTAQQDSVARSNRMLALVSGVTAAATPEGFFNPCDPIRPLVWSDFTGTPGATFSAMTRWTFPQVTTPAGTRFRAKFNPNSWVKPEFGNPGNSTLNGCDAKVQNCLTFFPPGTTGGSFQLTPGGGSCPAAIQPNPSIVATSAGDCTGAIAAECGRVAREESARLLRHEQLHFDIACVLAGKANAALAAGTAFATVNAALTAKSNSVTSSYDSTAQTKHGCFAAAQARWESDVANGLPAITVP